METSHASKAPSPAALISGRIAESYKTVVKLTFAKGASLDDPSRLFNASLDGGTRRAIDIPEGTEVNASAFKALVREAIAANSLKGAKGKR
jgi:hypothetical protein